MPVHTSTSLFLDPDAIINSRWSAGANRPIVTIGDDTVLFLPASCTVEAAVRLRDAFRACCSPQIEPALADDAVAA